ncbi:MAG: ribosome-associated translation inhibitor RaiA [Planctomycetota bacterium]
MRIDVIGRHGLVVTEPIRACAVEKSDRLLAHFSGVTAVEFCLEVEDAHGSKDFCVEMVVSADRHEDFVSRSCGDDLYLAIDAAAKKVDRQIRDYKDRLSQHRS